jgi:hypothetical protein
MAGWMRWVHTCSKSHGLLAVGLCRVCKQALADERCGGFCEEGAR